MSSGGLASLLTYLARVAPAGAALETQAHRLEYRIAWNGIPAAGATVDVAPGDLAGRPSVVVMARARTNAFVDFFWTFRGTARATFTADSLAPVSFVYDRQMNGKTYLTWTDFDPEGARGVVMRGACRSEIAVDDGTVVDPITAVFRARLSGARPGDALSYDIWTGETRYRVELGVEGPERIEVPAGCFDALRVVPQVWKIAEQPMHESRLRRATIWVADNPDHTLLRIRGEMFIGAVTLDLLGIEPAS